MAIPNLNQKPASILIVDVDQQVRLQTDELNKYISEQIFTQRLMLQQEKMAMISQLTAGIAHEINNPNAFISSNIVSLGKFFERLLQFTEVQQEALISGTACACQFEQLQEVRNRLKIERIIRDIPELIRETIEGVDRIKNIVNQLKRFSCVDESEKNFTDINKCLENTLDSTINEFKNNTKINIEYGELPGFLCYPYQLQQVFKNLLMNAVHAVDLQGEITVRSWNEDGQILIAFVDNGCGIPKHLLLRIFEPFFTAREKNTGTGLGLSVSVEIVRNHGGEITVESEVGKGSTFTVSIPLKPVSAVFIQPLIRLPLSPV